MKKLKKLAMKCETIRSLSNPQLRGAAGGITTPPASIVGGTACPGSVSFCACSASEPPDRTV